MSASIVISLLLFFIVFITIVFIISNRLKMKHVTNEQDEIKRNIENKTSDNLTHLNQIKKTHSIDKSLLNQHITTKTNEFRRLYNNLYDVDEELNDKMNESHAFLHSNINAIVYDLETKETRNSNRNSEVDKKINDLNDKSDALRGVDDAYLERITSNENLLTQYGTLIYDMQGNISANENLISSNLSFAMGNSNAILSTAEYIRQSNDQRFVNHTHNLNRFFHLENNTNNWENYSLDESINNYYNSQTQDLGTQFTTMTDLIGRVHSNDYFRENAYNEDKQTQLDINTNQSASNIDMNQRIDTNLYETIENSINIASNSSKIDTLNLQYDTLTDTLQRVGITDQTGESMSLTELNSNILHNNSNISHNAEIMSEFNDNMDSMFTTRFADVLSENTSNLNDNDLKTKIEEIQFDDLLINNLSLTERLSALEASSSTSSTNQINLNNYLDIGSQSATIKMNTNFGNNKATFSDFAKIQTNEGTTIEGHMNTLYLSKNPEQINTKEICFDTGLCLKKCDKSDGICINGNRIWDYSQAAPPS